MKFKPEPVKLLKSLWRNNKGFLVFLLLMFAFRSAIADWNIVPSESMLPTIEKGDRIWVNKLAYDVQVPFFYYSLYRHHNPKRGDVIVFESEVSELRLVKRVVAVPGDTIAMDANQVWLNGNPLPYTIEANSNTETVLLENLGDIQHLIRLDKQRPSILSSFSEIPIPKDFYFVLGDNRDNSNDSRFISLVPRDEIIGRATTVVMSHDYDNHYLPKDNRYFLPL